MTAPENPLVARVFVNRLWKLFFGQGLVKASTILARRGRWPTHPELLDWLAVEFRESGWDVKTHGPADGHVATPTSNRRRPRPELRQRDPVQPLARPPEPLPTRRRNGSRQRACRQRPACRTRSAGRASSPISRRVTGRYLNFPRREWQTSERRRPLPARPLHLLVAARSSIRPGSRSTPRPAKNAPSNGRVEHAAASTGAARTIRRTWKPPALLPSTRCTGRSNDAGPADQTGMYREASSREPRRRKSKF